MTDGTHDDHRRVPDRMDIDVVVIATPDPWLPGKRFHALLTGTP